MHAATDTRSADRAQVRSMTLPGDPPSLFAWLCVAQVAVILAMVFA
jgi:hypothetical protein